MQQGKLVDTELQTNLLESNGFIGHKLSFLQAARKQMEHFITKTPSFDRTRVDELLMLCL